MGRWSRLKLAAGAAAISGIVAFPASAGDDALWLARYVSKSEELFARAVVEQNSLALETNAVLLDVAIEQSGLDNNDKCWLAAVALHGLMVHVLTTVTEMRPVFIDRFLTRYLAEMPECESSAGDAGMRHLVLSELIEMPLTQ